MQKKQRDGCSEAISQYHRAGGGRVIPRRKVNACRSMVLGHGHPHSGKEENGEESRSESETETTMSGS